GVIRSTSVNARAPEVATSTVAPERSSASVRKLSVSGESSTTRTMSRLCAVSVMRAHFLQRRLVAVEVESPQMAAERRHEGLVVRLDRKRVQFRLDAADIADLAEVEKFPHMIGARAHQRGRRLDLGRRRSLI